MTSGFIALLSTLNPSLAWSLPFQSDPNSFAKYLSSLNWGSSSKSFSNLTNCTETDGIYFCRSGFVTISDPRGTMVCQIGGNQVRGSGITMISGNVGVWLDINNGTWREAAAAYLKDNWGLHKPGSSHHGSTYGCVWK